MFTKGQKSSWKPNFFALLKIDNTTLEEIRLGNYLPENFFCEIIARVSLLDANLAIVASNNNLGRGKLVT